MKRLSWLVTNWWILLLIIIILTVSICVAFDCTGAILRIEKFSDLLGKVLTPTCVVLGVILGYPLLKRKLLDGYITKQFEIMHETNRAVRKRCLILREKYAVKMRSMALTVDYLSEALDDMKALNELAIDANQNSYKYSYLVYAALNNYYEKVKKGVPQYPNQSYCEVLSTWIYYHLIEIYNYSKSIGLSPEMAVKKKRKLNKRISKYVTENEYLETEAVDRSISYYHNSALLVVFFNHNRHLEDDDWILYASCYEAAPSPSPFARMMFNSKIYIPVKLCGKELLNIFPTELHLVAYKHKVSTNMSTGIKTSYYLCMYANLSDCGFVDGCIQTLDKLKDYNDSYLIDEFVLDGISDFEKYSEMIRFKITEEAAKRNYKRVSGKLKKQLKKAI